MPEKLKLALVTDIHNGRDSLTNKGAAAKTLLQEFAQFVQDEQPDLIVELGDRISDSGLAVDTENASQIAAQFKAMCVPSRHLLGNHDMAYLSREDNERILKIMEINHIF